MTPAANLTSDVMTAGKMTAGKMTAGNMPVFTVTEISRYIREDIESRFDHVRIRGEISACTIHRSGHIYLRLKDTQAVLDAVIWNGMRARLALQPEEGLEVIATGRLSTYAGRSNYQLLISSLEIAGEGALLKQLEERRRRLAAEGLFSSENKRKLPFFPHIIGVITSPSGAVIRDILHRLKERCPTHVIVWPTAVQGELAAGEIVNAIRGFDALDITDQRPDVLIIARGGGSLEDLAAFNTEEVARAAAACTIPIISAIGHETDHSLLDDAADLRAPTPSAAAEKAVPVRIDLLAKLDGIKRRLDSTATRDMNLRHSYFKQCQHSLNQIPQILNEKAQHLDNQSDRLDYRGQNITIPLRTKLATLMSQWHHPHRVLINAQRRLADQKKLHNLFLIWHERTISILQTYRIRLRPYPIRAHFDYRYQHLNEITGRLNRISQQRLADHQRSLMEFSRLLSSCSHKSILQRGFALVRDLHDQPITRAARVKNGQTLSIEFIDKRLYAIVGGRSKSAHARPEQPNLFQNNPKNVP